MSFRESHWSRPPAPTRQVVRESCIALLDAHFLAWLEGHEDDAGGRGAQRREALAALLGASLAEAGVPADLLRCYWYTSQRSPAVVGGQIVRQVLPKDADGDASLVVAMARDLLQLARNHACAHVLIAADDDRLLPAIDEAQLHGLQVHLLADDSAADLDQLARTDPSWATLLRHADRRVVARGLAQPAAAVVVLDDDAIDASVREWWAGVDEAQREELAALLPRHRGLPQEADRQLLLRLSQQLGRSLEQGERKRMRETARGLLESVPQAELDQP
jgi:hypothetical protein